MAFEGYPDDTLTFMMDLAENNEREWFHDNRERYDDGLLEPTRDLVETLGLHLKTIRPNIQAIPKVNKSLFRINRDTRFSNDKRPYKSHAAITIWEGGDSRMNCPGFYMHFNPDELVMGGGIYRFSRDQLKAYREHVDDDERGEALREAVNSVRDADLQVEGQEYKRVPRGYDKEHPRADLLKHKGLYVWTERDDPELIHDGEKLIAACVEVFERSLPLHEWLLPLAE